MIFPVSSNRSIVQIIFVGLILRCFLPLVAYGLVGDFSFAYQPDSHGYIALAENLVGKGDFSTHGTPEILRTPGYPAMLTVGLFSGHRETVIILIQILLSVITVYLVFMTSEQIFEDTPTALASALIFAFEPLSLLFTSQILTETLFTTLLALFTCCLTLYLKTNSTASLVSSAIFISMAIYVRPAAYFLPLVMVFFLLTRVIFKNQQVKRLLSQTLVFSAIVLTLVGLWQVRNYWAIGFKGFSSVYVENMYFCALPLIMSDLRGGSWEEWRSEMGGATGSLRYHSIHPEQRNWNISEIMNWQLQQAGDFISAHFYSYLKINLKHLGYTVFWPGFDEYWRLARLDEDSDHIQVWNDLAKVPQPDSFYQKIQRFFSRPIGLIFGQLFFLLLLMCTYLCAVISSLQTTRRRDSIILIWVIFAYFVLLPGALGGARFRIPVMPLICVLSGFSLCNFIRGKRVNQNRCE